ncbi:MAG: CHAT domain-containing protein [Acidobacteria bacterium]|nr:CHAT domain-containing protein [Acidobacteriota bacterium]
MNPVELEIGLHNWDKEKNSYAIEMRMLDPQAQEETRLIRQGPALATINVHTLSATLPSALGLPLTHALFADPKVKKAFLEAKTAASAANEPLRIRLFINPNAQELHCLPWEGLCDPEELSPLFTSELFFFSRYIISSRFRPYRGNGQLKKVLLVVANPQNLNNYAPNGQRLTPIDVAGEIQHILPGLKPFEVSILDNKRQEAHQALKSQSIAHVKLLPFNNKATIDNLSFYLREGFDVLYLVCHGAVVETHPKLWLEDEVGAVSVVSGIEFVDIRLKELQSPPKLIVLASCQSGGTTDAASAMTFSGELSALGPRLADAGIPAVVAMQGSVKMKTVAEFMPVFFSELHDQGILDQAMSVARRQISDVAERAIPVLYMRLKNGNFRTQFVRKQTDFGKWSGLLNHINNGRCTTILGFGLLESLLPSTRDIAQRWAEVHHFPLAPYNRDDLPQVAQFLAIQQDYFFPRDELIWNIKQELLRRFPHIQVSDEHDVSINDLLYQILTDPATSPNTTQNPHYLLAQLRCPVYITAKPDNLMERAMTDFSRPPIVIEFDKSAQGGNPEQSKFKPTVDTPLVYNLFGTFDQPESLVLTEDDYFDYLIHTARFRELIPSAVRGALNNSALLFLGFQLDEWNFRVLFRSLLDQEGKKLREKFTHVAVQIDPQYSHSIEPDQARNYLQKYFENSDISIYEGTVEQFVTELHTRGVRQYGSKFLTGKKPQSL